MSKFDELKKQHKELALNDLDLMKMAMPDQANKYVEVLAKLSKSRYKEIINAHGDEGVLRQACVSTLAEWGMDYNYIETLETPVLWALWNRMETLLGSSNIRLFLKFANLNERKLIENNDVTSYKSFDEVEQAVSLAEMKLIDKELEKQIKKIYEDDTWISLRPLSLEASMKYGANTKWCTTTNTGQYYARYSMRGILIYNINKKTGYKVACFKNLDENHDNEFSWWDVTDRRIEALESDAPAVVLEAIRNEIRTTSVPNSMLMTKAESDKLHYYKEGIQQSQMHGLHTISDSRMYITGGFATIGTNSTLTVGGSGGTITYNPSTYTTTGNIGMSTTSPNTQLSIGGDIELNNGNIVLRADGEERVRLTPNGLEYIPGREIPVYRGEQALEQALRGEQPDEQYRINESKTRLQELMDEMVNEVTERAVEERAQQQSLIDDIELGILKENYRYRLQILAGIDPNNIASPEPPVEDNIYDPTKDPFNVLYQAEQPNVPLVEKKRKSGKSWTNKLFKKLWSNERNTEENV